MSTGPITRLLGRTPDTAALREALGDPALELLRADQQATLDGRVRTAVTFDGRTVGALLHDPALLDEPGFHDVVAVLGLAMEMDQVNALLREQRDLLSAIGDATPALLCLIAGDGSILPDGVNEAVRQLTGASQSSLGGKCFWEALVAEQDRATVERLIGTVVAGGTAAEQISRWEGAAGQRLVAWTCSRLPDVLTAPVFLVSGVDVTERELRAQELRESRSRLVQTADMERRRLERNLHDGAQQRLVSLSLVLRSAQAAADRQPGRLMELLRDATEQLTEAIAELRELARGLHPATLTDHGLRTALQGLASRSPVPVEVTNGVDGRLSGQVEAAVYYVVAETLTNVAKHANASAAQVVVSVTDGVLHLRISDDGVGGAALAAGSGLRGLSDRVEAVAGTLTVDSGPSGTTISASIPL